jgi:hypothetical protein
VLRRMRALPPGEAHRDRYATSVGKVRYVDWDRSLVGVRSLDELGRWDYGISSG